MSSYVGAHPVGVSSHRRAVVVAVVVGAALLAESIWAAPYLAQAFHAMGNARVLWLVLAVAAEMVSMMTFVRLQRVMLHVAGVPIPLRFAAATVFAANAMSVTLPGGGVAAVAYTSRRMWSRGAGGPLIGFAQVATAALSTTALAVIAAVGSVFAGDVTNLLLAAAEVTAAVGLLATSVAVLRRPETVRRLAVRGLRIARRDTSSAERVAAELSMIRPGVRSWSRAFLFALANWTADLCCLLAAAHAIGIDPSLQTAVLAYTAAMAASSMVPLLPGGLGVVEGAAILVLIHHSIAVAGATAAVLVYRLISLGAVATAGWLVVLVQQLRGHERAGAACAAQSDRRSNR